MVDSSTKACDKALVADGFNSKSTNDMRWYINNLHTAPNNGMIGSIYNYKQEKQMLNRYAFTMIELIFAIVIIAISVLSLPMMTQVNARGVENSLVQEAIFAASAELMGASAGYWDLNSMEDKATSSDVPRVIDIGGLCDNNSSSLNSRYRLRLGHIDQQLHRRCLDSNSTGAADTSDSTDVNLDNAEHASEDIFIDTTTEASGYKASYKSIVDVTRVGDIKSINITITDSNSPANTLVVLNMQSANIGGIEYYSKEF